MARKTKQIIISSENPNNRDKGKLFIITEMSAMDAERWASDALHGLAQSGIGLPEDFRNAGTAVIAQIGIKALGGMPAETLHNLMDRMMQCVSYVPDPQKPMINRIPDGKVVQDDIEEISTLVRLRGEWFSLQTGFNLADVKSLAAPKAPALN